MKRIAFLCDTMGRVNDVVRDDLGIVANGARDILLPALATPESSSVCFDMMSALRKEHAVYGWMIEMRSAKGPISLHFAGVFRDDEMLLIASEDISDVPDFSEELMRVNNEHVNKLRQLIKENASRHESSNWLDELSRLEAENAELQRTLASSNARLKELNDQKNALLGMAAHDLRNPLAAIRLYAATLKISAADNQKGIVQEIESSCLYMSNLISSFLNASSIESGTLVLDRTENNVAQVIAPMIVLLQSLADSHDVKLAVECDQTVNANIDANRICQVVSNLVSNAIAHSPKGSTILVRVVSIHDRELELSVIDQGDGIAPAEREHIFEMFHRRSGTSEHAISSFGIGLAIVDKIVKAHGGRVTLECPPTGGSQFTVIIPTSFRPSGNQ